VQRRNIGLGFLVADTRAMLREASTPDVAITLFAHKPESSVVLRTPVRGSTSAMTAVTAMVSRAARPILLLAGSGVSAVIPIATLSVATHTLDASGQGLIALALSISAYLAQVTGALIVEGPLADAEGRRIALSRWLMAVAGLGAGLLAMGSGSVAAGVAGILLLYPVLELTRVVCVVSNLARVEAYAAGTVSLAAAAALLAAHFGQQGPAWWLLAAGGFGAVLLRRRITSGRPTRPAPARITAPIVTETAVAGIVQPVLVATISTALGPLAAVGFRALTSLGGLMSPALGFLRLRLLSHNASRADRVVALGLLVLFGLAVVVLGETPLLHALFGEAWEYSSRLVLFMLVAWRLVVVASTFPFATLRRAGRTTAVLGVRIASSALMLTFAVVAAHWHGVAGAIGGLLLAESISFLLYKWRATR
jgi:hypothetical protein